MDIMKLFKEKKVLIAGPCSFGTYEELDSIAKKLKELNIDILRAGTFKGRTSPYAFQGLRDEGVEILIEIGKKYNIPVVTELTSIEQIKKYDNRIDIIQIGARNMYNYELLKEAGKLNTPVILKRGLSATYNEWLLSAEYIKNEGNNNIILCERGIRGFDSTTRNILDIAAVPYIKQNTRYPIIVDPSHATGTRYMIRPLSLSSIAAGADGIMVNFAAVGYSVLKEVTEATKLPVLGHAAGSGMFYEGVLNGMSSPLAAGKLARLAGADIVMVNTPYGGYPLNHQKYMQTVAQLVLPFYHLKPSMPSIGGGVHPGMVEKYIGEVGKDIVLAAGGAVQGHPGGAAAGARAMRQAIDIVMSGADFEEAAKEKEELCIALKMWKYVK